MSTTMMQEILRQEEQLADANRTLDLDALNRIYADELLMTGVLGEPTCTKAAILDEAKRGSAQREGAAASRQECETSCKQRRRDGDDTRRDGHRQLSVRREVHRPERRRPSPVPDDERLDQARRPLADRRGAHSVRARREAGRDARG